MTCQASKTLVLGAYYFQTAWKAPSKHFLLQRGPTIPDFSLNCKGKYWAHTSDQHKQWYPVKLMVLGKGGSDNYWDCWCCLCMFFVHDTFPFWQFLLTSPMERLPSSKSTFTQLAAKLIFLCLWNLIFAFNQNDIINYHWYSTSLNT